jgi:hypothetical protein
LVRTVLVPKERNAEATSHCSDGGEHWTLYGQPWSWEYALRAFWRHLRAHERQADMVVDLKKVTVLHEEGEGLPAENAPCGADLPV